MEVLVIRSWKGDKMDSEPRQCRKCGAMIEVRKTQAGVTVALDLAAPVYDIDLYGEARLVHAFVSHAATCPFAKQQDAQGVAA